MKLKVMIKRYGTPAVILIALVLLLAIMFRLTYQTTGIKLQAAQILVANSGVISNNQKSYLSVYPGDQKGNVEPIDYLDVQHISALALDRNGNLYIASSSGTVNKIRIYESRRDQQPYLTRVIEGPDTKLAGPHGLAVDSQGYLYVSNYGWPDKPSSIVKFTPDARDNARPVGVIQAIMEPDGSQTEASYTNIRLAGGIAVDRSDRLYVIDTYVSSAQNIYGGVRIFAAGAIGDVAPLVAIDNKNPLLRPKAVALGSNEEIYVSNQKLGNTGDRIVVYPPDPASDAPVLRYFESGEMEGIYYLAVDETDQVFVPVRGQSVPPQAHSILVFAAGAEGIVEPARKIFGPDTRLDRPTAIAVRGVFQFTDEKD